MITLHIGFTQCRAVHKGVMYDVFSAEHCIALPAVIELHYDTIW